MRGDGDDAHRWEARLDPNGPIICFRHIVSGHRPAAAVLAPVELTAELDVRGIEHADALRLREVVERRLERVREHVEQQDSTRRGAADCNGKLAQHVATGMCDFSARIVAARTPPCHSHLHAPTGSPVPPICKVATRVAQEACMQDVRSGSSILIISGEITAV